MITLAAPPPAPGYEAHSLRITEESPPRDIRRLLGKPWDVPCLVRRESWADTHGHTIATSTNYLRLSAVGPWARWGHIPGGTKAMWSAAGYGPLRERVEIRARFPDHSDTLALFATGGPLLEEIRILRDANGVALQVEVVVRSAGEVLHLDYIGEEQ